MYTGVAYLLRFGEVWLLSSKLLYTPCTSGFVEIIHHGKFYVLNRLVWPQIPFRCLTGITGFWFFWLTCRYLCWCGHESPALLSSNKFCLFMVYTIHWNIFPVVVLSFIPLLFRSIASQSYSFPFSTESTSIFIAELRFLIINSCLVDGF